MKKQKLVTVLALTSAIAAITGLISCSNKTSAHEHTYVWNDAVEATCTLDGKEGYYSCSGCDLIFDSEKKETTEDALKIDKKGHTYVWNDKIEATCTLDGKEGYYSCSGCDLVFDSEKKETTEDALKINKTGHNFVDNVCSGCGIDISGVVNAIVALPESGYTLADVSAINKASDAYKALSQDVQECIDATNLTAATTAIGDLKLIAAADTVASGGQCDQSLKDFSIDVSAATGYGDAATISYTSWQWANFRYSSSEKISVGTKVAFGIYNASTTDACFHWGDGATVYTNKDLATLKPGWNMITFTWEWDVNAINENYLVSTHIYALSPVGSGTDMNGWKFTGLYTYTDETAFNTIKTNTIAAVDAEKEAADLAALQTEINNLKLATLDSVLAKYVALTDTQKAKLENTEKLVAYKNTLKETIAASAVDNDSSCGSALTVSTETDTTYGEVAVINHTAGWANIKWNSSYEINENVYFVFYVYNPLDTDLEIAVGYVNDSQSESIFQTKYYTKQTLTAKSWTKVVVEWSTTDYSYYMQAGFFRMIVAPAGTGTNITGLKMTSMYILTDKTVLDGFIAA